MDFYRMLIDLEMDDISCNFDLGHGLSQTNNIRVPNGVAHVTVCAIHVQGYERVLFVSGHGFQTISPDTWTRWLKVSAGHVSTAVKWFEFSPPHFPV